MSQSILPQYDHTYSTPVEMVVYNDQVFARYLNGQVARINTDASISRIAPEVLEFVDDICSSDSSLWLHTHSGRVIGSVDGGETFHEVPGTFRCIGKDDDGRPVVLERGVVAYPRVTSTGAFLERTTTTIGGDVLECFVVKSDTVLGCSSNHKWLVLYFDGAVQDSFYMNDEDVSDIFFAGSSEIHVVARFLMRQKPSLRDGFRQSNAGDEIGIIQSFSVGTKAGKSDFIFVGLKPKGFGWENVVTRYNALQDEAVIINHPDTLGKIQCATTNNGDIHLSNVVGNVFIERNGTWLNSVGTLLNRGLRGDWCVALRRSGVSIIQTITSRNIAQPVIREFQSGAVNEIKLSSSNLVDSVQVIRWAIESPTGGGLLVGNEGILLSTHKDSIWRLIDKAKYYSATMFSGGIIVASRNLNEITSSSDMGNTWRTQILRGLYGAFRRAFETTSLRILFSSFGSYIVRKDDSGDSINPLAMPSRYTFAPSLVWENDQDFEFVGYYALTKDSGMIRFDRYHLDTIVESWETPLNLGYSGEPVIQLKGDTVFVFIRRQMKLFAFVNHKLVWQHEWPLWQYRAVADPATAFVEFHSLDSITIVRDIEGISVLLSVVRDSSTTSVQNIPHVYLQHPRPNPVRTMLTVDVGKFASAVLTGARLQLWSSCGEYIRDYSTLIPEFGSGNESRTITIDVSGVANGLYFLVLRNEQTTHAEKIIVSH